MALSHSAFNDSTVLTICLIPKTISSLRQCRNKLNREAGYKTSINSEKPTSIFAWLHLLMYPFMRALSSAFIPLPSGSVMIWLM